VDELFRDDNWRRVLSAPALTGDPTVASMSAIAGVTPDVAVRVADDALAAGLLTPTGVEPALAAELLDSLSPETYAQLHGAAARFYRQGGPDDLIRAITLARRAAGVIPHEELVDIVDTAAEAQLTSGDFALAAELFSEADGLDPNRTSLQRARRLFQWAQTAANGGQADEAATLRLRAFDLAEANGDGQLMTDVVAAYCNPPDWRSGSDLANRLLTRAERVASRPGDQARLVAIRAMMAMRIPRDPGAVPQVGWITQPAVAQPLADKALRMAADTDDEAELLALLAWRSTHRSPAHLAQRIETSQEAIELAQAIPAPTDLAQACLWAATDAIESASPVELDRIMTLARWAAERSGDPRASWLAMTMATSKALMDGRLGDAAVFKEEAKRIGQECGEAGTLAADLFFLGQVAIEQRDHNELVSLTLPADSYLLEASPSVRMAHSLVQAMLGNDEAARRDLDLALRQLDEEASMLWMLGIGARCARELDDHELIRKMIDLLTPWSHLVAVDSNAWWCLGPVSLALAELHYALGNVDAARPLVAEGAFTAEKLGDVRSLQRAQTLLGSIGPLGPASPVETGRLKVLSERERKVLEKLASGSTNQQIASSLAYSHATVRRDTISIYRKLGVNGRVEATALAITEGLVGSPAAPEAV
jgi:DNA-binding CsgD family transcriptional regulator/tetratricopeptide (TPR) repeat protein